MASDCNPYRARPSLSRNLFRIALLLSATTPVGGCGESSPSAPPSIPDSPRFLFVLSGDRQSAEVGHQLRDSIRAQVVDRDGRKVAGAQVTFATTESDSTSPRTATSGSDGKVATAWTLGTRAGGHLLTMGLVGQEPTMVTAIARSGPAEQFSAAALPGDTMMIGDTVRLALTVSDHFGNPVPSVPVLFSLAAGTTAGDLHAPAQTTDSSGLAETQWYLGATPGTWGALATVAHVHRGAWTATSVLPCDYSTPVTLNVPLTVIGKVGTRDCLFSGHEVPFGPGGMQVHLYGFSLQTQQQIDAQITTSDQIWTRSLFVLDSTGRVIATSGSDDLLPPDTAAGDVGHLHLLLPAGQYRFGVELPVGQLFRLEASASVERSNDGCHPVWVVPGLELHQSFQAGDCNRYLNENYERYDLYLQQGQTITVKVAAGSSRMMHAGALLLPLTHLVFGLPVAVGTGGTSLADDSTSTFSYTVPETNWFQIQASSYGFFVNQGPDIPPIDSPYILSIH